MRWVGPAAAAVAAIVAFAGCAGPRHAVRGSWEMPYPPKAPADNEIHHVPTGLRMSFDNAMEVIAGARLIAVGETHDSLHAHRVELAVIRDLARRFPGKVAIGMEMFREPQQDALDRWTKGELSEFEFLKASRWYSGWGSDFGYYRDIMGFAKENRIDVVALNPSKDLQQAVRNGGLDNASGDLRGKLPEIGEPDPYQEATIRGVYGGHIPSEKFDSFFRVQLLWEETMAQRVVDYLAGPRGEGKKIVTITGGWHVRHGFGLPKKVVRRMPMPYVIVLPEEISVPEDKRDRLMEVDLPEVPLHPADFVWFGPYEDLEGKRMRLGVGLKEMDNAVVVESVTAGSPAEKAGIAAGDTVVSFDGRPITETGDLVILVGEKKEGDRAAVVVRRSGEEKALEATFFPMPKTAHP